MWKSLTEMWNLNSLNPNMMLILQYYDILVRYNSFFVTG